MVSNIVIINNDPIVTSIDSYNISDPNIAAISCNSIMVINFSGISNNALVTGSTQLAIARL